LDPWEGFTSNTPPTHTRSFASRHAAAAQMLRGTATQPAARARVGSVGQRNLCVQEERLDD